NVNAMREITQLIEVNRSFESVSSLMRDSEDSFKEAVQTLGVDVGVFEITLLDTEIEAVDDGAGLVGGHDATVFVAQ
ncbi:flagellar basal body rod C-terminal domain-containing protein, partial [Rhizobium leguminosarum]